MFVKSMRPHDSEEPETWREQTVAPTLNGYDMRQGEASTPSMLISSTAASRARTSPWPARGPVLGASAARSGLSLNGCCASCAHDGAPLRMFPDSFPLDPDREPTSVSYSGGWSSSGMAWPGGLWTRDGSEYPSVAAVSSLSAVLESQPVPRRYWLSAKAAAGILRRAAKRGKELPPRLLTALRNLAEV